MRVSMRNWAHALSVLGSGLLATASVHAGRVEGDLKNGAMNPNRGDMHLSVNFRFLPDDPNRVELFKEQLKQMGQMICDFSDAKLRLARVILSTGDVTAPTGDIWLYDFNSGIWALPGVPPAVGSQFVGRVSFSTDFLTGPQSNWIAHEFGHAFVSWRESYPYSEGFERGSGFGANFDGQATIGGQSHERQLPKASPLFAEPYTLVNPTLDSPQQMAQDPEAQNSIMASAHSYACRRLSDALSPSEIDPVGSVDVSCMSDAQCAGRGEFTFCGPPDRRVTPANNELSTPRNFDLLIGDGSVGFGTNQPCPLLTPNNLLLSGPLSPNQPLDVLGRVPATNEELTTYFVFPRGDSWKWQGGTIGALTMIDDQNAQHVVYVGMNRKAEHVWRLVVGANRSEYPGAPAGASYLHVADWEVTFDASTGAFADVTGSSMLPGNIPYALFGDAATTTPFGSSASPLQIVLNVASLRERLPSELELGGIGNQPATTRYSAELRASTQVLADQVFDVRNPVTGASESVKMPGRAIFQQSRSPNPTRCRFSWNSKTERHETSEEAMEGLMIAAEARECFGVPEWAVGSLDTVVQHLGYKYGCLPGATALCGQAAYEPGVSPTWSLAWMQRGTCADVIGNPRDFMISEWERLQRFAAANWGLTMVLPLTPSPEPAPPPLSLCPAPVFVDRTNIAVPDRVMLVLDRSGSMSGTDGDSETRLDFAKIGARAFLARHVRRGVAPEVGLIWYNQTPELIAPMKPLVPGSVCAGNPDVRACLNAPTTVNVGVDDLNVFLATSASGAENPLAEGNTAIGSALKLAHEQLPADNSAKVRAVLLLTDGEETVFPNVPGSIDPRGQASALATDAVRVHTVMASYATPGEEASELAELGEGAFLRAPQNTEIVQAELEGFVESLGQSLALHHEWPSSVELDGPETYRTYRFRVEAGAPQFVLQQSVRQLDVDGYWYPWGTLLSPSGVEMTPDSRVDESQFFSLWFVNQPEPGEWTLRVPVATVSTGEPRNPTWVSVHVDNSNHFCQAAFEKRRYKDGELVFLTASAHHGGALADGVAMTALVRRPDNTSVTLPLAFDPARGGFAGLVPPNELRGRGVYDAVVDCDVGEGAHFNAGESPVGGRVEVLGEAAAFRRQTSARFYLDTPIDPPIDDPNGDCDNDGILNGDEPAGDTDHDGLPDVCDNDSDGDDDPDDGDDDINPDCTPNAFCANVALECSGALTPVPTACSGPSGCLVENLASDVYPSGTDEYTCRVSNDQGQSDEASCQVTVLDTQPPQVVCEETARECAGDLTPVTPVCFAVDLCEGAIPASSDAPQQFPLGTSSFTCSAEDGGGHEGQMTCEVHIVDSLPPVLTPPTSTQTQVVSCQVPPTPVALALPTMADACDTDPLALSAALVAVNGQALPAPVPIPNPAQVVLAYGTSTVRWSATDQSGNTGNLDVVYTLTQSVDTQLPVFTFVPPTVNTSTCVGTNIGQATATDDCGVPTVTNNAPSKFPIGTTIVTWTARDAANNVRTATQTVNTSLGDDSSCCPTGTNIIVGNAVTSDNIFATPGADCILGRGGNDVINSADGNDYVSGGAGNDTITTGNGNDYLNGGAGTDTCFAPPGTDTVLNCP